MRLKAEQDGLTAVRRRLRRLAIDVERRVRHRQRVELLVDARGQLPGEAGTGVSDPAPALEHPLLRSRKFTFDSLRVRSGRGQFIDAIARLLGPCEKPLDVRGASA